MSIKSNLVLGLAMAALPVSIAIAQPPGKPMEIPALNARAIALGIQPTELEIKGMLADIEGVGCQGPQGRTDHRPPHRRGTEPEIRTIGTPSAGERRAHRPASGLARPAIRRNGMTGRDIGLSRARASY